MSERQVISSGEIVGNVTTSKDGEVKRHGPEDDVVGRFTIPVEVVEYGTSTIFAGFQMAWGTVDIQGDQLELFSGAGLGSSYATIQFRGRDFVISAPSLIEAFLREVAPETLEGGGK